MTEHGKFCIVMTTCGEGEEARSLARRLVENRLAACVQMHDIQSVYLWKENVSQDPEVLLLIKTACDKYTALEAFIDQNHPYEVPELVRLPIDGGLPAYLSWIRESTR